MNEEPKIEGIRPKSKLFVKLQELPKTVPTMVTAYARHEDKRKRYLFFGLAGITIAALVIIILAAAGMIGLKIPGTSFLSETPKDDRPTARNAFDIALLEARKWQPDAMLAFMNSGTVGETGRSGIWKLIFISPKIKNKGLVVEVENYQVVSRQEIPIAASIGADFPADAVYPEEAIQKVRQMAGRADSQILGVEAIYDKRAKTWYWGVKTDRGVVSVDMKKQ